MNIDCEIIESLQSDFNSLWKCTKHGNTLEISVPYLLPNSTLFSIFLTKQGDRYIACDGGSITEILEEYCPLPVDEIYSSLEGMARKFSIKIGQNENIPLYFKDCTDAKLISSIAFDVANFAVMATSALVSASSDDLLESPQDRFETKAESFIRSIKPRGLDMASRKEIQEVPGFKFSAVLNSNSKLWLVSYVTGSNLTHFRRSLNDTAKSFQHAWKSSISSAIVKTIPLVNSDAGGYQPMRLSWQFDDLAEDSHGPVIKWSEKERLEELFAA